MAVEELEIGGKKITKGQLLYLVIGSANHDHNHFSETDQFNIERVNEHHLAFGNRAHYCIGHHLAKAEAKIAQRLF
ncbi:cytochrome P450 [Crocosphaera sp. Alani8]|uniref:cytochrome P450 n=1 Tax=Crocosphaera sp. Alani8 TaxID=3038952 RepID=UPI00406C0435